MTSGRSKEKENIIIIYVNAKYATFFIYILNIVLHDAMKYCIFFSFIIHHNRNFLSLNVLFLFLT